MEVEWRGSIKNKKAKKKYIRESKVWLPMVVSTVSMLPRTMSM